MLDRDGVFILLARCQMVFFVRIAVKASSRMNIDGANITTFAAASKWHLRSKAIGLALTVDRFIEFRGFCKCDVRFRLSVDSRSDHQRTRSQTETF